MEKSFIKIFHINFYEKKIIILFHSPLPICIVICKFDFAGIHPKSGWFFEDFPQFFHKIITFSRITHLCNKKILSRFTSFFCQYLWVEKYTSPIILLLVYIHVYSTAFEIQNHLYHFIFLVTFPQSILQPLVMDTFSLSYLLLLNLALHAQNFW